MTMAGQEHDMALEPSDPVPEISARNQHGETVTPDFENVAVVYFYVEDGTPGCETQTEQFERESDIYEDAGVTVYGISTDGVESHRAFADAHGITFDLLADPDGELCEAFGVGRDHGGRAERTTFVIDGGETVRKYESVAPDGHAREVLLELYEDGIVELDL